MYFYISLMLVLFTIYLYIYESRSNDFILAVNFVIRKTLLIEEQLLRVQNLALTNPQVFPTNTKISFQNVQISHGVNYSS